MKIKVKVDLTSGFVLAAVSVALAFSIPNQVPVLTDSRLNSRTFPYGIVIVMLAMSIRLIAADVVRLLRHEPVREKEFELGDESRALLLFGLLIAYVTLMALIGSLASSLIMGVSFLIYFRTTSWVRYAVVVLFCVMVFLIFRNFLGVQLP